MQRKSTVLGNLAAVWGLAGVFLLLTSATVRLAPLAIKAFEFPFSLFQWISLAAIVVGMAYMEGYKGFQKGFSPRVAARARYLRENPRFLHILLAPFFCMGYFHATRRRKITSISLTLGIIVLILMVRMVEQPWRGIIDAGVVVGLAWGVLSLVAFSVQGLGREVYPYDPEVPAERE
jgi:hypothetical protein